MPARCSVKLSFIAICAGIYRYNRVRTIRPTSTARDGRHLLVDVAVAFPRGVRLCQLGRRSNPTAKASARTRRRPPRSRLGDEARRMSTRRPAPPTGFDLARVRRSYPLHDCVRVFAAWGSGFRFGDDPIAAAGAAGLALPPSKTHRARLAHCDVGTRRHPEPPYARYRPDAGGRSPARGCVVCPNAIIRARPIGRSLCATSERRSTPTPWPGPSYRPSATPHWLAHACR